MTLNEIQKLVENHFKVNLRNKNRHKKHTIPKVIYYDLCERFTNKTIQHISNNIGFDHAMVVYSRKAIKPLFKEYPAYELSYKLLVSKITGKEQYIEKIIYKQPTFKTDELRQLNELDDYDILDFNNTRLKPYLSMLKSRRVHNITEVKGALLRN